MNREVFLRCGVFASLSYEEIEALLGCISARAETVENNRSFFLDVGSVALLVSGELSCEGESYIKTAVIFGEKLLLSKTRSELLVFSRVRLMSLCKNACSYHRRVLFNLAFLSETTHNNLTLL